MPSTGASGMPSSFVTVMAQVSIVLGLAGTAYALVQAVAAAMLLRGGELGDTIAQLPMADLPLAAAWLLTHLEMLAWSFLLASAAFLAVSVGLLRRRRWAWWGFVAFMVLGALANFAGIALVDRVFAWVQALPANPDVAVLQAELAPLHTMALAMTTATAVVFAVLHGLIVWKLCTPEIRAEFPRH
ncbi:hypothetical protein [Pseudoxanthomonas putridarboris]|uniref:Uncharacterized protein n=1 Tax=Pseudoxanthomonas putridarboris TaxID=752605 RepID=A0ABU9J4V1_9GAMM